MCIMHSTQKKEMFPPSHSITAFEVPRSLPRPPLNDNQWHRSLTEKTSHVYLSMCAHVVTGEHGYVLIISLSCVCVDCLFLLQQLIQIFLQSLTFVRLYVCVLLCFCAYYYLSYIWSILSFAYVVFCTALSVLLYMYVWQGQRHGITFYEIPSCHVLQKVLFFCMELMST